MTRRVLAATIDGRSRVIADEAGLTNELTSVRGFDPLTIWLHAPGKALTSSAGPSAGEVIMPPPRGGATICLVTFPPDSWADANVDPATVGAELFLRLPGLAQTFEPDSPGMHTTPTTDVGFVISGHPVCKFDQGDVQLNPGDVILQQRTRHGWQNPGDIPATIAFVLIDDP